MRILDIIKESTVDEAISVTQYERQLTEALYKAVWAAAGHLYNYKGRYEAEEASLDDDEGSGTPFKKLMAEHLLNALQSYVPAYLKKAINSALGVPVVTNFSTAEMKDRTGGYAQDRDIVLNEKYLVSLRHKLIERIMDSVYDSYNENERTDGFYYTVRMLANGDRYLTSHFADSISKTVDNIVSITLHELVHVMQHNQQEIKGRDSTEYRSYLDKTKGEFRSLANDDEVSHDVPAQHRYWDLYMASPQEIAAFAHQAALKVIKDSGFDQATVPEELQELDSRDIINAVNNITNNRFKQPTNAKEQMVRNRYLKLAYQEVHRFIQNKLTQLKK